MRFEYRIPMRHGVKSFMSLPVPKNVFSSDARYPILLRISYSVSPYGADRYRAALRPPELFPAGEAHLCLPGRPRPFHKRRRVSDQSPSQTRQERPAGHGQSTDIYDTIGRLIWRIPGNTGKVGIHGVSQPGFCAAAGMIDAHPGLVAATPQAPVTD
jgi:hypothetical protein